MSVFAEKYALCFKYEVEASTSNYFLNDMLIRRGVKCILVHAVKGGTHKHTNL